MTVENAVVRRILIAALGTWGDVKPWLALGRALAAHGHQVRVATSVAFGDAVGQAGLGFAAIRPQATLGDPALAYDCMAGPAATQNLHHLYILPHIDAVSESVLALCGDVDLLISNQMILGAPSIAAKAGIAWMMAVVSPMALELPVFQPAHADLPWMINSNAMLDPLKNVYGEVRARLNQRFGLASDAELPLPARILCLFPPALARQNPAYDFTPIALGAAFDPVIPALDDRLAAFLSRPDRRRRRRLAVMSLGSMVADAVGCDVHEAFIAAARALGIRAVLLVGKRHAAALAHPGSETVFIASDAPHSALFPHADVVVHHGGVGTMLEALRAGKPSLVLPFAHDQPWNALLLHERGLGMTISPKQWDEHRVQAALKALLDEPEWRERAQLAAPEFSAAGSHVDGAAAGAAFVHGWLAAHP